MSRSRSRSRDGGSRRRRSSSRSRDRNHRHRRSSRRSRSRSPSRKRRRRRASRSMSRSRSRGQRRRPSGHRQSRSPPDRNLRRGDYERSDGGRSRWGDARPRGPVRGETPLPHWMTNGNKPYVPAAYPDASGRQDEPLRTDTGRHGSGWGNPGSWQMAPTASSRGPRDNSYREMRLEEREKRPLPDFWCESPPPEERKTKVKKKKQNQQQPSPPQETEAAAHVSRPRTPSPASHVAPAEESGDRRSVPRRSEQTAAARAEDGGDDDEKRNAGEMPERHHQADDKAYGSRGGTDGRAFNERETEKKEGTDDHNNEGEDEDEDLEFGPQIPSEHAMEEGNAGSRRNYGGAMRPGEAEKIASFVQAGKRVPRRGEVGYSGEEIERLEAAGYVMSGSRHKRMNAIRLRKENQVYSAEERRALLQYNYEEQKEREDAMLADLRSLLQEATGKKEGEEGDGTGQQPPNP